MAAPLKVTVVGCGNWGSAAAKVIAENTAKHELFDETVRPAHAQVKLWVFEEMVDGVKLSEIINTTHENKKYLPGVRLPNNIVAVPDLSECVRDADLFVFVIPHQFAEVALAQPQGTAKSMKATGLVKPSALAITLVKGMMIVDKKPVLISDLIETELGVPCSALSGANVANVSRRQDKCIARMEFSEATIAYTTKEHARVWELLFDRPYFKTSCIGDVAGTQVYGAIKNVVAIAAGFCDGLGLGTNTKAAIMRMGLIETHQFAEDFFPNVDEVGARHRQSVVMESAGVADLITTCFGGRNVKCAAEFAAREGKRPWSEIEAELLHGQKMQVGRAHSAGRADLRGGLRGAQGQQQARPVPALPRHLQGGLPGRAPERAHQGALGKPSPHAQTEELGTVHQRRP